MALTKLSCVALVCLVNAIGQVVAQETLLADEALYWDLGAFPAGIYYIKADALGVSRKLILNK